MGNGDRKLGTKGWGWVMGNRGWGMEMRNGERGWDGDIDGVRGGLGYGKWVLEGGEGGGEGEER